MICTVLPSLEKNKFVYVNLAHEADLLHVGNDVNPYFSVENQNSLLAHVQKKYDADVTFGGFLEDRSNLWRDFEPCSKTMIHLGVDINNLIPGTKVAAPSACTVYHVFYDSSKHNGWGGRLILKLDQPFLECGYLVIGHLGFASLPPVGTRFASSDLIAEIGEPEENGNWFAHGHFQLAKQAMIDKFASDLDRIDGYFVDADRGIDVNDWTADPTTLLFKPIVNE